MLSITSSASRPGLSSTPVIDLTVESIDLTALDDTPPTSPRASGEPPRKRQRLSDDTTKTPPRTLKACLETQVKPYIDAALARYPAGQVNAMEIGRQVLCRVGSTVDFTREFAHRGGFLSPALEQFLASKAHLLVSQYASKPEYQLKPFSTASTTLAPTRLASATPTSTRALSRPSQATPIAVVTSRATIMSKAASITPAAVTTLQASRTAQHETEVASPANYRTKARARSWQSWKTHTPQHSSTTSRQKARSAWVHMPRRPYITTEERLEIRSGSTKLVRMSFASAVKEPIPFHVDFTSEELEAVRRKIREVCGKKAKSKRRSDTPRELGKLLRKYPNLLTVIPPELELKGDLSKRDQVGIRNFLDELADRHKKPARRPKVYTLEVDEFDKLNELRRSSQIPSLLLAREFDGNRGFGSMRRLVNFKNEFRKAHEDDMEKQAEWVNCAGDIMTVAWTSNHNFICGTTTHSDSHNQQYNRDGNLLLCSSKSKQLKAFSDHRIPRPVVEKGDNSTEAMRESQSPWLYSSVASSDYDKDNDRAYTSSYDQTVKVWKVDRDGKNMAALGTWQHAGNVNFVAASKHESGMVATAADVASQAVRVYHVDDGNVSESPFRAFSGSRAWNEDDTQTTVAQKWAYCPATMQWGLTEGVQHLLLVGYSPRSFTGDDDVIPMDKRNSGEICLWNCLTGERIKVTTASTQNVFEVAWHPTQPVFIVATSPAGLNVDDQTQTQIRVFRHTHDGEDAFGEIQCLDCPASDINELTIKPSSAVHSYITAACTDSKVYVWDTARGDKPVHVLRHRRPIDKEDEDVGVKFTAWGTTADRFYTGGPDGVVKVWNVRNSEKPLIRDLLEAPGCITCGSFSPDFSRLVIGDATGRVMLLSLDREDEPPADFIRPPLPPGFRLRGPRPVRRPLAFLSHDEPPAPNSEGAQTGVDRAKQMLASGHLEWTPNRDPTIGVVQGPAYAALGLYRREFHLDGDPFNPLLARNEEEQQENKKMFRPSRRARRVDRIQRPIDLESVALRSQHAQNLKRDLDLQTLDELCRIDSLMDKISIQDPGWDFGFEDADHEEE